MGPCGAFIKDGATYSHRHTARKWKYWLFFCLTKRKRDYVVPYEPFTGLVGAVTGEEHWRTIKVSLAIFFQPLFVPLIFIVQLVLQHSSQPFIQAV